MRGSRGQCLWVLGGVSHAFGNRSRGAEQGLTAFALDAPPPPSVYPPGVFRPAITVNAIGPGWFRTPLNDSLWQRPEWVARTLGNIPQRRGGLPEDLGPAAVFLASPAADYITGITLYVDGGYLAVGHQVG